jgi:hypothetical protein
MKDHRLPQRTEIEVCVGEGKGKPGEEKFTVPLYHNDIIQLLEEYSELSLNMRIKL